jgi:hypothetical protein
MGRSSRYTGERDSEIKDQLEDFIIELLSDACGLMTKDEVKKQANDLKSRAFAFIEDQLHSLETDKNEKIEELECELDKLKSYMAEMNNDLNAWVKNTEKLQEEIDDLNLKLQNPTQWASKRYGLD